MDNEVVLYAVVPLLWLVSSAAAVIFALAWLLKKNKRKAKRRFFVSAACAAGTLAIMGTYPVEDSSAPEPSEKAPKKADAAPQPAVKEPKREEKPQALPFLDDFTKYGYSTKQIRAMREILVNVGITEITDPEIGNVSYGMQTVKGVAFKDKSFGGGGKEVQVRFNIENGVLYLVSIYCPSYHTANQPTYLSGLEDRRAELYYDAKGGYLKKIDWKNKAVVGY